MTIVCSRRIAALVLAVWAGAAQAQADANLSVNAQLLAAARQNDMAQVERTLTQGAAPNSRNRLGKTALLLAPRKATSHWPNAC